MPRRGTRAASLAEFGQDTETVLLEMGRGWEDIERLKNAGVIPDN